MNFPDEIEVVLTYKHDLDDTDIFTEKVGAVRHGEYYQLIHIPAFAKNLAIGDLIKVEYDDGEYRFEDLVEESGNSTIHIVLFDLTSRQSVIDALTAFRCGVNSHVANNYLVVNVAPDIFYQPIQEYLISEEMAGSISFRESCLSRAHAPTQN